MLSTPPDLESNLTPDSSPPRKEGSSAVSPQPATGAQNLTPGPSAPSTSSPASSGREVQEKEATASTPPLYEVERGMGGEVESGVELGDEDQLPQFRPIDPALIYLILLGVTVLGLNALDPAVRYTTLWTILIIVGLLALLFDALEVEIPTAQDMGWGIGYGLLLGVPLLIIALPQLQRTSLALFDQASETLAFQSLVLIMPAAESLFFRGAMQPTRGLLFTAIAASVWSMIVFFPQLHVMELPLVAAVIGFMFVVLSLLYSYVKRRFGLFASWTCQVTINVLLLFVVRFIQLG